MNSVERFGLMGELSLDGALRLVRGALPIALRARESGLVGIVVPETSVAEAAVVDGLEVRGAATLELVVRLIDCAANHPMAEVDRWRSSARPPRTRPTSRT
jgi:magnesium chelatase family protein